MFPEQSHAYKPTAHALLYPDFHTRKKKERCNSTLVRDFPGCNDVIASLLPGSKAQPTAESCCAEYFSPFIPKLQVAQTGAKCSIFFLFSQTPPHFTIVCFGQMFRYLGL